MTEMNLIPWIGRIDCADGSVHEVEVLGRDELDALGALEAEASKLELSGKISLLADAYMCVEPKCGWIQFVAAMRSHLRS